MLTFEGLLDKNQRKTYLTSRRIVRKKTLGKLHPPDARKVMNRNAGKTTMGSRRYKIIAA